ncbi:MAG: BspA family leucine-rich repeat surface protein, partial [Muribaculaceae bacterium]|nr:BspA family leucine-rich repeat surface protein [Muribaculaceae bacterium]
DAEGSEAEAPDAEGSEAEAPDAEGSEAETPDAEGSEAEAPDAEDSEAETSDAEDAGSKTEEMVSENTAEPGAGEEGLRLLLAESGEENPSGSYQMNGSNTTWVIDQNGKLTVEGTGEFGATTHDQYGHRTAPWDAYAESIKTAEIKVDGMTDASGMFYGCINLTEVDLKNFDLSSVTNMSRMFCYCENLTSVDTSGFDTSKVTDMSEMFYDCLNLARLDLSSFDTSAVQNMASMFDSCAALEKLDLSSFDTSAVQNMASMFNFCSALEELNLSSFETSKVTDMSYMFNDCWLLKNLDVGHFDTSKVTNMESMFGGLHGLKSLDLDGFDTSKVECIDYLFNDDTGLESLDLSSFDLGSVKEARLEGFFPKIGNLKTICTPRNLHVPISLRSTWYRHDGTELTELPQGLDYSIVITRNKQSAAAEASITATKKRTAYLCGERLNVEDITLIYYDEKGSITKLTTGFSTDADKIDLSRPGLKTLTVTYVDPKTNKTLTCTIDLTVTFPLSADSVEAALPSKTRVYNGSQHKPVPTVTAKSDRQELAAGKDYTVSYEDNTDAGEKAKVIIRGKGDYSGELSVFFTIEKAPVTIKAQDVTLALGDTLPVEFACETEGFFNGDERKVTDVSFTFSDTNGNPVEKSDIHLNETGVYKIIPQGAQVGDNYVVDAQSGYRPGILTIAEERVSYTVTFEMMGHGIQTEPVRSVKAGTLIAEPEQPEEAGGYLFTGWHKDRACTKTWNFDVDTVQGNITLYARWTAKTGEGGIRIQEIPEQAYMGSTVKPAVVVYAADGKTLLKSGRDYTVKYYNNTAADQEDAAGGTASSLTGGTDGAQGGFDSKLPYVEIKGKGSHAGYVYSNFHIRPAAISDGYGNAAAGFTLKCSEQLAVHATKDQKPFSSLKYKKSMTAGKDYTVRLEALMAYDSAGNDVSSWSAEGSKDNKWIPAIPKGYRGTFRLTIVGEGNYSGEIRRTVYVDSKENLLKNAKITLGKNQKNMPYNGGAEVKLTPGYCEEEKGKKKYYRVDESGEILMDAPEENANSLFTVKAGSYYLQYGTDYTVSYTDNRAVGTAVMTITGRGEYKGSKSVSFKITGTAFRNKNLVVEGIPTNGNIVYTGRAQTWNRQAKLSLIGKDAAGGETKTELRYGTDYTVSYKNNIKKGT